jgi:glycosyltransferase involved in cell wall biosynthesis
MRILYASVNIDHHSIPLAQSIANVVGKSNFKYAVLKPIESFRVSMGFNPNNDKHEWVIRAYENEVEYNNFFNWFFEADVVLFSDRNLFSLAQQRLKKSKLTFYFSERWWKPSLGKWRLLHPKFINFALQIRQLSKNVKFHYLAQGAYASDDIQYLGKFENRIWNWGYFTDVVEHKSTKTNDSKINILWCGRMLKWKKVDNLIKAFSVVIKENTNCHLTLIGDGTERNSLIKLSEQLLPHWSYDIINCQTTQLVRETMNHSDIFVLPSNGYEGWGAVINESMAEGCAVIASIETGGGKSIILNSENGILYKSGNWKRLYEKIKQLIYDEKLLNKLKSNGKITINEYWAPEVAANRFLNVCDALLNNKTTPKYLTGPMQKITSYVVYF